ncbi:amino acid adenylation domain-containing protein [Kitasatospora sp. NPDC051170]|uniref:amino acid adenylation domain-containing protein n=1 Tax=Kitasatospora sp. NPDC051170 TaxID=3364056 RepID=UPI0037B49535
MELSPAFTTIAGPPLGPTRPILELLRPWPAQRPDHPAVTDPEGSLTYRQLHAHAARLAGELAAAGVRAGEPVAVRARPGRWAVAAMLGVLAAGAQYVPVDTGFPAARQQTVLRASGARFLVLEAGEPESAEHRTFRVGSHEPPDDVAELPELPADRPAYTMYTSGSSGTPKGVTVSHGNLGYSTEARTAYYGEAPSVFLLCSSISFDSSAAGIYWSLATGAHLVVPGANPLDTEAIARAAARHHASHLLLLPSLYAALLDAGHGEALASLRCVIVAGESCPPALVREHFAELPGASLHNEYGPTECTVWSLAHTCRPEDAAGPSVPIGRPIPGASVHLASVHLASDSGELWVSGPGVALGYAGHTERGPFAPVQGRPGYRTGDLARLDEAGAVHFLARADDQLKLAGMRIELPEIEQLVREHAGAAAAAVGVVRQPGAPVRLVAFVVAPGPGFDPALLYRALLSALPQAAAPRTAQVLERLPALPNGKLDRAALNRLAAEHATTARTTAARTTAARRGAR